LLTVVTTAQNPVVRDQFPSPMQENSRSHGRIPKKIMPGRSWELNGILAKPVTVYIPKKLLKARKMGLLLHFHGSAGVVAYASENSKSRLATVTVNLGAGSGVYGSAFSDSKAFERLVNAVWQSIEDSLHRPIVKKQIILSGFSAGYGAIRKIISAPAQTAGIQAVLLLDGLHASYIPENRPLAEGGLIDTVSLEPFLRFAEAATEKKGIKVFVFTHSEIFPGTFVSTTETANYLARRLGTKVRPVLRWGPGGMQQITEARLGRVRILGFAGNTAPDHIDHLHGLYHFLHVVKAVKFSH